MALYSDKILNENEITTYHFNTKFRKDYYKTPSTRCQFPFTLTDKFKSVRLSHICIPNSWYLFSSLLDNNKFIIQIENETTDNIEILEVVIPDGNYTPVDLEQFLNTTYFHESGRTYGFIKIKFCINKHTLKSSFSLVNTSIEENVKFHVIFVKQDTSTIMSTCGWLLGFRYGKYYNVKDEVYSEGLYDGGGDRYIYFCLTNTELEDNYNKHVILLDNERESLKSSIVLAKLYLKNGKFSINVDDEKDTIETYNKILILKTPKEFSSISINVIDQYGQEIFLNNMDFSFSLEFLKSLTDTEN
jgi:hypothetical protein